MWANESMDSALPKCMEGWSMAKRMEKVNIYSNTKKDDTKHRSNYQTIALIPYMSKIQLKIIQQHLNPATNKELPDVQTGFWKGREMHDHIASLRWMMEKAKENQKDLYMCFIDHTKFFDCIDHDKRWNCPKELEISPHHTTSIQLIQLLYSDQAAAVRMEY